MANFIGAMLGAILAIYVMSRLIEWLLLKRIIASRGMMILVSTATSFFIVCGLWYSALGKPYAQDTGFLLIYLLASVLLTLIRYSKSRSSKVAQN
jgi:fructose-specific phosphotransferase system IIC component